MITEAERDAINKRLKAGIPPTEEEMAQLLEYAQAEALRSIEAQGLELTCPHCMAPIPAGTLTCAYCGGNAFDEPPIMHKKA